MKCGYVISKPTTLAKEGYGLGKTSEGWDGIGLGILAFEGWDGKIIPTEPNALSDYLKGISL